MSVHHLHYSQSLLVVYFSFFKLHILSLCGAFLTYFATDIIMGAKLGKKNTLQPEEEKHHSVSLLENLPREVVWEIIKYTDEAILSLRKVRLLVILV